MPRAFPGFGQRRGINVFPFWLDDQNARQAVFGGKVEVALIVRGHGHDRPRSIAGQNEIADPDGNPPAGERMQAVGTGENAFLFQRFRLPIQPIHVPGTLNEGSRFRFPGFARNQGFHQRMFRSERHEGHAENRIRPRGEHGDAFARRSVPAGVFKREDDFRACRFADPVALHVQHALGPAAFQLVQIGQQFVGIGRDLEEPLREFLLHDRRVATPAHAVHHLFVGQYGVACGAPVLRRLFSVDKPLFQPAKEEELLPAVVGGVAGGKLPIPVVGIAEPLELGAHVGDVGMRPFGRMDAVLDGRVFGGKAESVPPYGMKDVEALHPSEARHHIAYGIVAHMPHVKVP